MKPEPQVEGELLVNILSFALGALLTGLMALGWNSMKPDPMQEALALNLAEECPNGKIRFKLVGCPEVRP